ncbi:hypothetical protein GCM10009849_29210 [Sinomonas flava]|uniref:Uncharacterized protein n=1 Tax=Sinomonas flava TaxID=496857 RepID=A0ABP5NU38_9MICC
MTRGLRGSDVPFLTRRVKEPAPPTPSPAAPSPNRNPLDLSAPPAPSPSSAPSRGPAGNPNRNPLDLSQHASPRTPTESGPSPARPAVPPSPESRLYPAPAFGELRQLTASDAVVRLNPRQSGIGSLIVTGTRGVAWEGEDRTTGAQSVHREEIGTPIPTAGNRPLVGYHGRDALIVLRHVRLLRRALFIAAGPPMTVQTFDGSGVAVQGTLAAGQRTVLTLARIGSMLEMRAESVPEEWDDGQIWREFAFTMTVGLGGPRR